MEQQRADHAGHDADGKNNAGRRVPNLANRPGAMLLGLVVLSSVLARVAVWAIGQGSGWWTVGVLAFAVFASYLYVKWARRLIRRWVGAPNLKLAMAVTIAMTLGGAVVLAVGSAFDWWFLAGAGLTMLIVGFFSVDDLMHRLFGTQPSMGRVDGRAVRTVIVDERPRGWFAYLAGLALVVVATLILVGFMWWLALLVIVWWLFLRWFERRTAGRGETAQSWRWWLIAIAAFVGVGASIVIAASDGSRLWFGSGVVVFLLAGLVISRVVASSFERRAPTSQWLRLPSVLAEQQRQQLAKHSTSGPDHDPIGEINASPGGVLALFVATAVGALIGWWLHAAIENVSWSAVWLIVAGCLALGAVPIMRGETYLVAVVLTVATVWAVADRDGEVEAWQPSDGASPLVVLGDSFSSGEGASSYLHGTNVQGGNNCRRSPDSYGVIVARTLGRPLITFACSGAVAKQIHREGQVRPHRDPLTSLDDVKVTEQGDELIRQTDFGGEIAGRRPQLDDLEPGVTDRVDLVLLSIGGNDAMFGDVGRACVLPGSCKDIEADLQSNLIENVLREVDDALYRVALRYPHATIGVLGYPGALGSAPSIDDAEDQCGKNAPDNTPLDEGEVCVLRAFLTTLNDTVESAVGQASARLDEPDTPSHGQLVWIGGTEEAFDVEDATEDNPPMNMLKLEPTDGVSVFERVNPGNWPHNSFHPTERGHELLAAAVLCGLAELDGNPFAVPTRDCPDPAPGAEPHPVDYAGGAADAADAESSTAEAVVVTTPPVTEPPASATTAREDYERAVGRKAFGTAADSIRDVLFPYGLILILIGWLAALWGRFARIPEHQGAQR